MGDGVSQSVPVARAAWWGLGVCTCATAVLQMDGTMVTVAVPALARDLGVDTATVSWVLTAYFVPFALTLLPGGRLVDQVGARRVAVIGLLLFALGAVLGALAPTFGALIASRVLQGVAAGLVSPAALVGAVSGFPPERRGAALGIWGAGSGGVSLLGPLAGGLLTAGLGWRSNWWALLAISIAVGVAIARVTPSPREGTRQSRGDRSRAGRVVAICTALTGVTFLVLIGGFLVGQEYLQQVVGESALAAAATLLIGALASGITTPLAGWLTDRRGEALPIASGLVLLGGGLAILGSGVTPLYAPVTAVLLVTIGAGFGLLFSPVSRAALNAVSAAQHGRVSAWLSVGRLAGAALGAGLAGLAATGGLTVPHVRYALLGGAVICAGSLALARPLRTRPAAYR
jgi:DHA2 family methylenomycin A resistance protein-like MFS transporter